MNYESLSLPPEELVKTTYDASARLVAIKQELGLMKESDATRTLAMIKQAQILLLRMEEADRLAEPERTRAIAILREEARAVNKQRVYDQKDFVSWGGRSIQLKPLGLILLMAELFFEELGLAWRRFSRGRYAWRGLPYAPPGNPAMHKAVSDRPSP